MGFLHKVKNAAQAAAGQVQTALEQQAEAKKQKEAELAAAKAKEEQAKAEREERERKEKEALAEKQRQERIAKMLEPTCDKGDCLWYRNKFFFTCSEECECERKRYTQKDWNVEPYDQCYWPYMKRLEKKDDIVNVCTDFANEFLPEQDHLLLRDWGPVVIECDNAADLLKNIIGIDLISNQFLSLLLKLYNTLDPSDSKGFGGKVSCFRYWQRDCSNEFYLNPSLYKETLAYRDFKFIAIISDLILNSNTRHLKNVTIDDLLDENGDVKPCGIGGPKAGEYGNTIWNTLVECGVDEGLLIAAVEDRILSQSQWSTNKVMVEIDNESIPIDEVNYWGLRSTSYKY